MRRRWAIHLAYLAADIDQGYVRPNAAQYAVFDYLKEKAATGNKNFEAAIAAANKAM